VPQPESSPATTANSRAPASSIGTALLILLALLIAPALALWRLAPPRLLPWIAGWLSLASLVAFTFYAWDKRRAVRGEWRTPEKILHLCALLGGWPGAFLAQRLLRHKNAKVPFQIVFWLIVVIFQYIAVDALLDWRLTRGIATAFGNAA
jgi:uncharacterized membrane protein YsdA (DUF1294 family)